MKRREILKIIAPAILVGACKENEKFTLPTIVTGKVTYEDGSPVEGAELRFSGKKRQGLSRSSVFREIVFTDASGLYSVSHVVPKECDFVEIFMSEGSLSEPAPTYGHTIYWFLDGAYQLQASTYMIPYSSYGKTTTLDYQLRKR